MKLIHGRIMILSRDVI